MGEISDGLAAEFRFLMPADMADAVAGRWQSAARFGINSGLTAPAAARANGVPTAFTWATDILNGGGHAWYRALGPRVLLTAGGATLATQAGWFLGTAFKVQVFEDCEKMPVR